ncbi:MAG: OmpA family protein [Alphaproteobacteria bacterium]|nr:OmpA family protein [Alphaproteobacteria bacterium]
MKSVSKFLPALTLVLMSGMVISCSGMKTVSSYPGQVSIEAREINATHRVNQCALGSKLDMVVNFATGSDKLSAKGTATVKKVAAILKDPSFRGRVTVVGYTDSKGDPTKNLALSQRRAARVMNALIAQGVSANVLSAEGLGEADPVATNSTAAGRAANRRAAFVVN